MSNSNNMGKELKRLRKEADELLSNSKGRRFHFLVLGPGQTEEEQLKEMIDAGKFALGDEYQIVEIPWIMRELKGSAIVPEGNSADPYADPRLSKPEEEPIISSYAEEREREERWKKHVQQIKRDGQLYDPDKPKDKGWR